MSKSKISRDEMRRRIEAKEGGRGAGEQGSGGAPVRVTVWAGMRNYECQLCAYASLDVGAMVGHLRAVHNWVEAPLPNPLPGGEGTKEEEISQDEVM